MIDTHSDTTGARTGEQEFLSDLRDFLEEHGVALENAAGFLGGPRWARRVMQLRYDMSIGALSPRACHREITAVLVLLHAHVACVTELCASRRCLHTDGSDPHAEDIRQLHNRLQSLVGSVSCADNSLFRTPA
jgi:hypothetical protein